MNTTLANKTWSVVYNMATKFFLVLLPIWGVYSCWLEFNTSVGLRCLVNNTRNTSDTCCLIKRTLGGNSVNHSVYRRMDRQPYSSNTTPPPQLVAGGYNYDKRFSAHSKYSFSFELKTMALKMLFKCFTSKHCVSSLALPWGQNPYPGDHQI